MIISIPLTGGKKATIDSADLPLVSGKTWRFHLRQGDKAGYAIWLGRTGPRCLDKRVRISMHRFLLGAVPGQIVDHINGDTLDNRRSNLRIVSSRENAWNKTLSGVTKSGSKWIARITKDGVRVYLGTFLTHEEARLVYEKAAEFRGEFRRGERRS